MRSSVPRVRAFSAVLAVLLVLVQPISASANNSPHGDIAQRSPAAMNNDLLPASSIIAGRTLHADGTGGPYPVTFDSQGGSAVAGQTVNDGDYASAPADPTRTGFTFGGWFDSAVGGSTWNFGANAITGATTIYAHWSPIMHNVLFSGNGGLPNPTMQTVAHGGHASWPINPVRDGYYLAGWYTHATGGFYWDFYNDAIVADLVLFAQWTAYTYTVTFDAEGGSAVGDELIDYSEYATDPGSPTRTGYSFDGWYDAAVGGTAWDFGANAIVDQTSIYAQWTPIDYTLSFDSQGGSAVGSQTVAYDDLGTAPTAPTLAGYTFDGWYTLSSGGSLWDFGSDTMTGDRTLFAQWTLIVYTVTFDSHGGSAVAGQVVAEGGVAAAPSDPTRAGYTFDGWFDSAVGGATWTFATHTILADAAIHAHWTVITHGVTFDSTGGTAVAPETVNEGGFATSPTSPARPGYIFDGWFTSAVGGTAWGFATDAIMDETTIIAHWTAAAVVSFDPTGGGAVAGQTIPLGDGATPPPPPSRLGFAFLGWFTAPTGGTQWDFADAVMSDTTLYARWAAQGSGGGLAGTGADAARGSLLAIALLASGVGLLVIGLRRRSAD